MFSAIQKGSKYLVEKGIDIKMEYTTDNLNNIDAYEFARQYGQTEIATYLNCELDKKK